MILKIIKYFIDITKNNNFYFNFGNVKFKENGKIKSPHLIMNRDIKFFYGLFKPQK